MRLFSEPWPQLWLIDLTLVEYSSSLRWSGLITLSWAGTTTTRYGKSPTLSITHFPKFWGFPRVKFSDRPLEGHGVLMETTWTAVFKIREFCFFETGNRWISLYPSLQMVQLATFSFEFLYLYGFPLMHRRNQIFERRAFSGSGNRLRGPDIDLGPWWWKRAFIHVSYSVKNNDVTFQGFSTSIVPYY